MVQRSSLVAVLVALLSVAYAAPANAAGGAACGELIKSTQTTCAALAEAEAELQKLQQLEGDALKAKEAEIKALELKIAKLQQEPLADSCEGLQGVAAAPTCDRLASIMTALLGEPPPVTEGKKEGAAAVKLAKQPDRQTATNKSGSSAQVDPVESIQPITLAGGAISLSGTRSGTKGVGTITVNPLALAKPEDAALGRVFDLSVSAPFDLDGGTDEDRRYVSARLRVNATAPISSARLNAALKAYFSAEGKFADLLEGVLERAPDLKKCVKTTLTELKVTKEACGETLEGEFVRKLHDEAYAEVAKARRAADAYYVGIDARLDTGDPTGAEIPGDKGTHLLGGAAAGVRIPVGSLWDWELRGRLAGDYFKSRDAAAGDSPDPVYSADWGVAMILSGRMQEASKQRMAFGVGVEGRHAGDSEEADLAPTNYANLNLMAVVPAANGGDIGLALSIPMVDSAIPRGVLITLSTDLGIIDGGQD